jgi:hypothetical protein
MEAGSLLATQLNVKDKMKSTQAASCSLKLEKCFWRTRDAMRRCHHNETLVEAPPNMVEFRPILSDGIQPEDVIS